MGSVRARQALGLVSLGLLGGIALASLHAGALLAAGIFTGLLTVVSAALLVGLCRTCQREMRAREALASQVTRTDKTLLDTRALLAAVLDALPHPVALVGVAGRIDLANRAAAELGLTPGAALSALAPWVRDAVAGSPHVHADGDGGEGDTHRVNIGQRERLLLSRAVPLKGASESAGMLVILTDVTDARHTSEARAKSLSVLSHDLKSPMTSIQMSLHLLLEDASVKLSARHQEFLQAARDDAYRLHHLIEEMVRTARARP